MASIEFLTRTDVSNLKPLLENGLPIVSLYSKISEFFSDKKVSTLLPEPGLSEYSEETGYTDVRWYSTAQGNHIVFPEVEEANQADINSKIKEIFSILTPTIVSSSEKGLLLNALMIPSQDDIRIVEGEIVFTNWGFIPADIGSDEVSLRNHFQSIYGDFCSIDQIWPIADTVEENKPATPNVKPWPDKTSEKNAQEQKGTDTSNAALPPRPPQETDTVSRPRRFPIGFFVFMALLMILIGLLLGWFTSDYYAPSLWPKGTDAVDAQEKLNESLGRERDELKEMLKEEICQRSDVKSLLDPGQDMVKRLPDDLKDMAPGSEGEIPASVKVAEVLENSAVMVLSQTKKGISMGTGFLISNTHIITNRHVVEGNTSNEVVIVNKKIGKAVPAKIQAKSKGKEIGQRDYAVLTLNEQIPMQPLVLAPDVAKLSRVYTGGYPGFLTSMDPALEKLFNGQLDKAPEMIMSSGEVSVVQKPSGCVPIVVHTAEMSQGNSGGPLIDQCGRVIAINTFIASDPESGRRANFSLSSEDLMAFLDEKKVDYKNSQGVCQLPN